MTGLGSGKRGQGFSEGNGVVFFIGDRSESPFSKETKNKIVKMMDLYLGSCDTKSKRI